MTGPDPSFGEQRSAARKGLIATAALSLVFAASEGSGIHWAVDLSGLKAWLFLFFAHLYYALMWVMHDGMAGWTGNFRPRTLKMHYGEVRGRTIFMASSFTITFGFLGFVVIGWNLVPELIDIWWPTPTDSLPLSGRF